MLQKFLNTIATPNGKIQIGELDKVYENPDLSVICQAGKNIYFLGGVAVGTEGRAKDKDVCEKNYIAFDFDLANDRGWTPEQIKIELKAGLDFLLSEERALSRVFAMVFSGGGGHLYYRTPLVTDFANWRVAYEFTQAKLEEVLGWKADSACKNPGRIMRLPGSKNVKRGVQSEILYLNTEALPLFDLENYAKFKPITKTVKKVETKLTLANLNNWTIRQLPNKKMLELLSGHELIDGEVISFRDRTGGGFYIDVNGQPADAWVDTNGQIGSGKGGGPTWVEWLKYYGKTEEEVNAFLVEKGVLNLEEECDDGYEIDKHVKVFTWGTPRLDATLTPIRTEQSNLITGLTSAGKTTFAFDVAWKNVELGHRVLYLSLEMSRKEIETRLALAYAGITKAEWREPQKVSDFKKLRFRERVDQLRKLKGLLLSGMPDKTPPTTANIFKLIKLYKPDLVFLDNFDLIQKQQNRNAYDEENRISRELLDFPKAEQIPIIILHHRKKGGASSIDGVRGSGKITHDRYTALRCEREYNEDASAEDNAAFWLVEEKDRGFGTARRVVVYFKLGSFYDNYL